jgi:hypothetical protein
MSFQGALTGEGIIASGGERDSFRVQYFFVDLRQITNGFIW